MKKLHEIKSIDLTDSKDSKDSKDLKESNKIPKPMKQRGCLIVFEGIDRCGKSTQVERLKEKLSSYIPKGSDVYVYKFPDRSTETGILIDLYLKGKLEIDKREIHLQFAKNRREKEAEIRKHIYDGDSVIIDRYAYSGVAYSYANGLEFEWCKILDIGLPLPDIIIFINITFDEVKKRKGFGGERYEDQAFLHNVKTGFGQLIGPTWVLIDGNKSIEDVENDIDVQVRMKLDKFYEKKVWNILYNLW